MRPVLEYRIYITNRYKKYIDKGEGVWHIRTMNTDNYTEAQRALHTAVAKANELYAAKLISWDEAYEMQQQALEEFDQDDS